MEALKPGEHPLGARDNRELSRFPSDRCGGVGIVRSHVGGDEVGQVVGSVPDAPAGDGAERLVKCGSCCVDVAEFGVAHSSVDGQRLVDEVVDPRWLILSTAFLALGEKPSCIAEFAFALVGLPKCCPCARLQVGRPGADGRSEDPALVLCLLGERKGRRKSSIGESVLALARKKVAGESLVASFCSTRYCGVIRTAGLPVVSLVNP